MLAVVTALASVFNLDTQDHYLHLGFIEISIANLIVIVLMVVVFILAITLPFHRRRNR
jgi:hypothetical protein